MLVEFKGNTHLGKRIVLAALEGLGLCRGVGIRAALQEASAGGVGAGHGLGHGLAAQAVTDGLGGGGGRGKCRSLAAR